MNSESKKAAEKLAARRAELEQDDARRAAFGMQPNFEAWACLQQAEEFLAVMGEGMVP